MLLPENVEREVEALQASAYQAAGYDLNTLPEVLKTRVGRRIEEFERFISGLPEAN